MKLNFYKRLPEILYEKIKLKPDDVFINITHSSYEDWSFGNGKAQLLKNEYNIHSFYFFIIKKTGRAFLSILL